MGNYLFLLLLLACPLMMVWMMRGMHGRERDDAAGGHGHGHAGGCGHGQAHGQGHAPDQGDARRDGAANTGADASLAELRRQREQLDREIEAREETDDMAKPAGAGRR